MLTGDITCLGKDGVQRTFYYSYTEPQITNNGYRLNIYATPDYSDQDFFELVATPKGSGELKITTIRKNDDIVYGEKGIPDAAIPKLITLSGMGVCSSSQKHPTDPNEYRTDDATKFWERIRKTGKATYDQGTDVYTHT